MALAGDGVMRAEARAERGRVLVRAWTSTGSVVWEFHAAPSLICLRIDARPRPPRRFPVTVPASSGPAIRRFVRAIARLQHADGPHDGAWRDDDVRLRALSDALFALRTADEAAAVPIDDTDRAAPSRADAALYLDACAGRWERVFAATGAGASERPDWLTAILTARSGDLEGMRAVAARPSREIGARALLDGATLALAGLHDASLARHRRAVEQLAGRRRADAYLEMARLSRERGARAAATEHARRALLARPDDDEHLLRCAGELVRGGAFDDAHRALAERCIREPVAPGPALALAELLLRAGRPAEARRWLGPLDGDPHDLRQPMPPRMRCATSESCRSRRSNTASRPSPRRTPTRLIPFVFKANSISGSAKRSVRSAASTRRLPAHPRAGATSGARPPRSCSATGRRRTPRSRRATPASRRSPARRRTSTWARCGGGAENTRGRLRNCARR